MKQKRTLTLLVELDPDNKPEWIWGSHMRREFHNGICVKVICEGDCIKEDEDDLDEQ